MIMDNRGVREDEISTISSNMLMNFRRGIPQSPHDGIRPNEANISHDNFLKTGDNNLMDCINLAGHVTNFVDNEISLDFLQSQPGSTPVDGPHTTLY